MLRCYVTPYAAICHGYAFSRGRHRFDMMSHDAVFCFFAATPPYDVTGQYAAAISPPLIALLAAIAAAILFRHAAAFI